MVTMQEIKEGITFLAIIVGIFILDTIFRVVVFAITGFEIPPPSN